MSSNCTSFPSTKLGRDVPSLKDTKNKLGAVVLCGGKSSRLGIDKTQLVFQGQTFLERVVAQVSKVCDPVVLVGKTDFEYHSLPDSVLIDHDEDMTKGPLEGIRVGLKRLADSVDFGFVTSCDVPLLRPELIEFLWSLVGDNQAVVPIDQQRVFGMTAIYRTDLHQQINQRIANDQLRVSELATAFQTAQVGMDELKMRDPDMDSLTNINSVENYLNLLERFEMECPAELSSRLGL